MIVVDASLVVKWFIDEADSDLALDLLSRFEAELAGPDFLAIEVSRALVAAINARRIAADAGRAALQTWFVAIAERRIALFEANVGLLDRAAALALDLGHPLADCLYLALAIERDADLVTCDLRFHRRAAGVHPRMRLLNGPPHRTPLAHPARTC
jgi:predicted nucleic acid-binding protein